MSHWRVRLKFSKENVETKKTIVIEGDFGDAVRRVSTESSNYLPPDSVVIKNIDDEYEDEDYDYD